MSCELTIGIPTCGRPAKLAACLRSIREHVAEPHHVIIVDSGATPETERVLAEFSDAEVHCVEQPFGPSASRALIMDRTDTPYLLFLDDDNEVRQNTVATLRQHLESSEETDLVGGSWWEYDHYRPLGQYLHFGTTEQGAVVYKSLVEVDETKERGISDLRVDLTNATLLLRRRVWDQVRFDPRYDFYYELFDFFMQCREAQLVVAALPGAVFDHKPTQYQRPNQKQLSDREADRMRFAEKWGVHPMGTIGSSSARGWWRWLVRQMQSVGLRRRHNLS